MIVIDPGHRYVVYELDGSTSNDVIQFVKREGPNYPGNMDISPGTIMQECLRVCIDRGKYVNSQIFSWFTWLGIWAMRVSLWCFEWRAAIRHHRLLLITRLDIENEPICMDCGHIKCRGHYGK